MTETIATDEDDLPLTRDDYLDIAGDYLAEDDVRLIVTIDSGSRFAAWEAATAEFGTRIAVIHAPHGEFGDVMAVQYGESAIARAIVAAFTAAGADVEWTGWSNVEVRLP
jgi:hypothetical protein